MCGALGAGDRRYSRGLALSAGVADDTGLLHVVIGLYIGFGLFSILFWAYFRYRSGGEETA